MSGLSWRDPGGSCSCGQATGTPRLQTRGSRPLSWTPDHSPPFLQSAKGHRSRRRPDFWKDSVCGWLRFVPHVPPRPPPPPPPLKVPLLAPEDFRLPKRDSFSLDSICPQQSSPRPHSASRLLQTFTGAASRQRNVRRETRRLHLPLVAHGLPRPGNGLRRGGRAQPPPPTPARPIPRLQRSEKDKHSPGDSAREPAAGARY